MNASLKVKISPEYLAVRYGCQVDGCGRPEPEKDLNATLEGNTLGKMITKGMECSVGFAGMPSWNGTISKVCEHDGKISIQITKKT